MNKVASSDLVRTFLEQRDGLFGFVLALTRDREAAEEIFQDVGLAIVEEAGRGTRVERFLPWAHELARRRVAEYYRKTSRRRTLEHSESLDEALAQAFEENAPDPLDQRLRQESLEACLEELSPAQRELIEGRYRDRASARSLSQALGWTEGSVKVTLWRVRRELGRCIEEKMGGRE
jgi:RNA polymerase sigma-70 factor (ECF subfamily)